MRAAVLRQLKVPLKLEEIDIDEPRQGQVLVRIAASGICGSDIHVFHGQANVGASLPLVLGHEGAGARGGNGFPGLDIPRILDLYHTRRLKLDELVGAAYELDDIGTAFDAAAKAEHGRVVLRVTPSLL